MQSTHISYSRTKIACYLGFVTQAICGNFAPLLYLTFNREYGVSIGQLALISTCFFLTQLVVDFACTYVADKVGYRASVIAAEVTSGLGLVGLAVLPDLFPSPYTGILIAVMIYAVGSGLTEVLVSPIIEACPFDNKDSMMSLLHSFYCWGCVGVVLLSTLFFAVFGLANWRILACIWALVPLYNIYNFVICPIVPLTEEGKGMTVPSLLKTGIFWLLILLMIGAGASELTMAQWASAFAESALHVSKSMGDLMGPCGFAVMMGISRLLYGKFGEKIDLSRYMIGSGCLAVVCYLLAALSSSPVLGFLGCIVCGFSVGIMWPGSISVSSAALPAGGTAMFALLALAGDLGGAIGPGIAGAVSQAAGDNLKMGILAGIGFPILLTAAVLIVRKKRKAEKHE